MIPLFYSGSCSFKMLCLNSEWAKWRCTKGNIRTLCNCLWLHIHRMKTAMIYQYRQSLMYLCCDDIWARRMAYSVYSEVVSVLFIVIHFNTRSTQNSPVRQQNAWFDTKKPGSTQKCPPQHEPVDIAIIKHPPPPSCEKYFFPILFPYFFKNQ